MKRKAVFIYLTLIIVFTAAAVTVNAQDKKISEKQVPAKVLSAFHKAYPKAEIKGTSIESENGHHYYEIESMEGTKHIDLLIEHNGKIAEVEETIPESELPLGVTKTLKLKYKGYKLTRAEKVTSGKKLTYELGIEKNGRSHEIVFNKSGKLIKSSAENENEKGEKGEKDEEDD